MDKTFRKGIEQALAGKISETQGQVVKWLLEPWAMEDYECKSTVFKNTLTDHHKNYPPP